MTNIMDRMTRMEAEMIAKDEMMEVRDQRIAVLENAVETLEKAVITKDIFTDAIETRDSQMCELEEEMKSLTGRITETEETDVLLRGMVDQVRNPPFAFQCAWQDGLTSDNSVITYDRLTYDEISGGSIYNVTGGLDINTGVFTVGFSGVWAVTYSIQSWQYSGEYNQAWLFINGEQISESEHYQYNGDMAGDDSLGSRTLYMRLESGDNLTLKTGTIQYLSQITLCFELVRGDE